MANRSAICYNGTVREDRLTRALAWATELHAGQVRKGTAVPYITHPVAVAGLVAKHGGTEDEVVAALLHDVVEDTEATITEVEDRFGSEVAKIVSAVSHVPGDWKYRKLTYLEKLADPSTPKGALVVAAADKLHNARDTLVDVAVQGPVAWEKFNAGVEDQLWWYQEVASELSERLPGELTDQLVATVDKLVELCGVSV